MPVVFTPLDHEFAASSGSNVNYSESWSYFDHPPTSTADLTITSNPGDPDPYTFETGETYDITWTGHGGGTMEDATIIRSDDWGSGQGVVVFEGINSNTGELFQMVYTPNFNLEDWYWSNGGGPSSPNAFWTDDQNANTYSAPVCYAPGTLIDGIDGPRPVETLRAGDLVRTLDHGLRPVRWMHVARQNLRTASPEQFPIRITAGALGPGRPASDLIVSAQHRILVGGQSQLDHLIAHEVFFPAKALTDLPGISHLKGQTEALWVHFALDRHEIVTANGCFAESLLLGKMVVAGLPVLDRMQVFSIFGTSMDTDTPLNGPLARRTFGASKAKRLLTGQATLDAREMAKWQEDTARELDALTEQQALPDPGKSAADHPARRKSAAA